MEKKLVQQTERSRVDILLEKSKRRRENFNNLINLYNAKKKRESEQSKAIREEYDKLETLQNKLVQSLQDDKVLAANRKVNDLNDVYEVIQDDRKKIVDLEQTIDQRNKELAELHGKIQAGEISSEQGKKLVSQLQNEIQNLKNKELQTTQIIENVQKNLEAAANENSENRKKINNLNQTINENSKEIERLHNIANKSKEETEKMNELRREQKKLIEEYKLEKEKLVENINNLQKEQQTYKNNIDTLTKTLDANKKEITKLQDKTNKSKQEVNRLNQLLKERENLSTEQEQERSKLIENINKLKKEQQGYKDDISNLTETIKNNNDEISKLRNNANKSEEENKRLNFLMDAQKNVIKEHEEKRKKLEEINTTLQNEKLENEKQIKELGENVNKLTKTINENKSKIDELRKKKNKSEEDNAKLLKLLEDQKKTLLDFENEKKKYNENITIIQKEHEKQRQEYMENIKKLLSEKESVVQKQKESNLQIENLNKNLEQTKQDLETRGKDITDLQSKLQTEASEKTKLVENMQKIEKDREEQQKQILEYTTEISKLKQQTGILREEDRIKLEQMEQYKKTAEQKELEYKNEIEDAKIKIQNMVKLQNELQDNIEKLETEKQQNLQKQTEYQTQLQQLSQNLNVKDTQLKETASKLEKTLTELRLKNESIEKLDTIQKEDKKTINDLNTEIEKIKQNANELSKLNLDLGNTNVELATQVTKYKNEADRLINVEKELEELNLHKSEIEKSIEKINQIFTDGDTFNKIYKQFGGGAGYDPGVDDPNNFYRDVEYKIAILLNIINYLSQREQDLMKKLTKCEQESEGRIIDRNMIQAYRKSSDEEMDMNITSNDIMDLFINQRRMYKHLMNLFALLLIRLYNDNNPIALGLARFGYISNDDFNRTGTQTRSNTTKLDFIGTERSNGMFNQRILNVLDNMCINGHVFSYDKSVGNEYIITDIHHIKSEEHKALEKIQNQNIVIFDKNYKNNIKKQQSIYRGIKYTMDSVPLIPDIPSAFPILYFDNGKGLLYNYMFFFMLTYKYPHAYYDYPKIGKYTDFPNLLFSYFVNYINVGVAKFMPTIYPTEDNYNDVDLKTAIVEIVTYNTKYKLNENQLPSDLNTDEYIYNFIYGEMPIKYYHVTAIFLLGILRLYYMEVDRKRLEFINTKIIAQTGLLLKLH